MRSHLTVVLTLTLGSSLVVGCPKPAQDDPQSGTHTPVIQAKAGGAEQPSGPAAVIACDKPEHDFGTVSQGDEVKHTFNIRNTGQGTLKIARAQGG